MAAAEGESRGGCGGSRETRDREAAEPWNCQESSSLTPAWVLNVFFQPKPHGCSTGLMTVAYFTGLLCGRTG